jgi:hypothetical protein
MVMLKKFEQLYKESDFFYLQAICLFLFLFPLFFQLSGSVFISNEIIFNTQGRLDLLPLPISVVACFIGILVMLRYEDGYYGVGLVFLVYMLMMLSTLITTSKQGEVGLEKYLLLMQFLLPMFGLILGHAYLEPKSYYLKFEAIALYVLLIIIPLEVVATLMGDTVILSPSLYFFSLYQHIQYLPVVFVSLYFLSIVTLFENKNLKYLILFLAPWFGAYIVASFSLITIITALILIIASLVILVHKGKKWEGLILVALFAASSYSYYMSVQNHNFITPTSVKELDLVEDSVSMEHKKNLIIEFEDVRKKIKNKYSQYAVYRVLPESIEKRFIYWDFYMQEILASPKVFLFGHNTRPNRDVYPSAYNYYLDIIYYFGVIVFLPFIYLFSIVIIKIVKIVKEGKGTVELFALFLVVMLFMIVDNSLKVSCRQPYSGMVIFFLIGKLLFQFSLLLNLKSNFKTTPKCN